MAIPVKIKAILLSLLLLPGIPALAQVPADGEGYDVEYLGKADEAAAPAATDGELRRFSDAELQELVGPVALYPDDLLAIVLPASTYPLEIVQAARFLEKYEADNSLKPDEEWDESVVALLNYPEVLRMLDDDIDWTWQLGDAVLNQQDDVIGAIEGFRDRAYAAGNLKSDQHQTVSQEEGIIEIIPIDDDVIYVPYYEPAYVVERQPAPVYHYYAVPRPVYYYPYPVNYAFSSGYFWGVTTAFRIGWTSNHLLVQHPSYWGHPYYGYNYYDSYYYYRRPSITVYNTTYVNNTGRYPTTRYRDGDYWRPRQTSIVARRLSPTHTNRGSRGAETQRAHTVDYRNTVSSAWRGESNASPQRDARATRSAGNTTRSTPAIQFRDRTSSQRAATGTPRDTTSRGTTNRNSAERNATGNNATADRRSSNPSPSIIANAFRERSTTGNATNDRSTATTNRAPVETNRNVASNNRVRAETRGHATPANRNNATVERQAPVQRQVQQRAEPQQRAAEPRQAVPQQRAATPQRAPAENRSSRQAPAAQQPRATRQKSERAASERGNSRRSEQ